MSPEKEYQLEMHDPDRLKLLISELFAKVSKLNESIRDALPVLEKEYETIRNLAGNLEHAFADKKHKQERNT